MNLARYTSLFIFVILLSGVSIADTPDLPHIVDGDVSVDGGPFDNSYSGPIYAVHDGTIYGHTQADEGSFSDMTVTGPAEGEFTFWIGQVETDTSLNYESGNITELDEPLTAEVDDLNAELDASQTNVEPGDTVEFDASSSSGSTGINSIQWSLPDDETRECEVDNVASPELDCETIEYTFDDEGTFDIELTVFDASGNADTAEQPINVEAPNTGGGGGDGDDGGGGGGGTIFASDDDTEDVNESNETASEAVNDTDDDVDGTIIEPEDQQPPVPDTNATTTGTDDTTTGADEGTNETPIQEQQVQQGGTGIGGFITANTPSIIGALVGVLIIGGIVWYVRRQ